MWRGLFDRGLHARMPVHGDGCGILDERPGDFTLQLPRNPGLSLYVPETYTPGYAYPLICFLHDTDGSERDVYDWFPRISGQNFLAVGVRAPFTSSRGLPGFYRWSEKRPDASFAAVREAARNVAEDWSVHPQRQVLFGEGQGAVIALQQLLLAQSHAEGAAITGAICHRLPRNWQNHLPFLNDFPPGRILFLQPPDDAQSWAAIDGLDEAGFEIAFAAEDADKAINHWMMAGIPTTIH